MISDHFASCGERVNLDGETKRKRKAEGRRESAFREHVK
jgi:hypothetical protein